MQKALQRQEQDSVTGRRISTGFTGFTDICS